jgi:hypothetical protein
MTKAKLLDAARGMDWQQAGFYGHSPCFHMEADGRFCARERRWVGHLIAFGSHDFVSLYDLLQEEVKEMA